MSYEQLKQLMPSGGSINFQGLLAAFPILEEAKTTPQSPVYHREGDVWTHTMMVLNALIKLPEYTEATEEDQFIVFYAALLHDVAKYSTTVIDETTGKISQPGHSKKGAIDARIMLWKQNIPFEIRESICRLITNHQVPFFIMNSPDYLRKIHQLSWSLPIHLLSGLAKADIIGRICDDQQSILDNIEIMAEVAKEEGCYNQEKAFVSHEARLQYARHAKGLPDYEIHAEPASEVYLMCGIPASGKNYWVSNHHPDLPVVSFDDAKAELGLKHGKNDGMAAHFAIDKAKDLLRNKKDFVWNATHLSSQMRDKSLDILFNYGAKVNIVYLETTYLETLKRNSHRETTITNKEIEKMLHRWEVPLPWEAQSVHYLVGDRQLALVNKPKI